jgi:hypothetical protein
LIQLRKLDFRRRSAGHVATTIRYRRKDSTRLNRAHCRCSRAADYAFGSIRPTRSSFTVRRAVTVILDRVDMDVIDRSRREWCARSSQQDDETT